jgi:ABC-2 type transport system ATP-binding protein
MDASLTIDTIVELRSVTRLYGTVIGVNDLNLELGPGAYGLVGPNGAGKSTLIGLLCGALRPTGGSVKVFGKTPSPGSKVLQRIGVCPASELLLARTSALSWIMELLMLSGYRFGESKELAIQSLRQVGMEREMHQWTDSYSLGMRQRVKLAQAIAHNPDLLILDEPFNGLDPVGRIEMTDLLQRWCEQGKTLLLASHVLSEVEAVTDSFLLIYGGRLLASGTSQELRDIVADLPQEIMLSGIDVSLLAGRLADQTWVDSVRLSEDRMTLRVTARHVGSLFENLTTWIATDGLRVDGIRGSDGGLASLFDTLTRRHRGFAK